MSIERRKVLEMLAQGRVTIDEAERLLSALGESQTPDWSHKRTQAPHKTHATGGWPQFEGFFSEMKDVFGDMDDDIRSTFTRAEQTVRVSMPRVKRMFTEAVPDVDQIIDKATSSLPDISSMLEDVGRNVGMAFKSWSASVDDDAFPHRCERELNKTYPLESGSTLQLKNPRGSISVAGWDRADVGVRLCITTHAATASAATSVAEAVQLEGETATSSLVLRPLLSDPVAGAEGRATLNFQLMVPKQARLELDNQFGALKVEAVDGPVKLVNRHGPTTTDAVAGELCIDQTHGPLSAHNSGADLKLRCLHAQIEVNGVGGEATVECSHEAIKLASIKGSLTLNAKHGGADIVHVGGDVCVSHDHGTLKAKSVAGSLVARNNHGSIIVEGVGKSATIKNSHGPVRLVGVGAEATVDGDRGRITVESVSGRVVVRSNRSPIAITDAGAEVTVDNEKGDIVLTSNAPVAASYRVSNRRGNVHIHLPPDLSSLNVDGYVRRGFVETDLPLQVTANGEGGQTVSGQIGGGSAPMQIDIERGHLSLKSSS